MAEGRRQFLKSCGLAALTIVAYATSTRISGSTAEPVDERLIAFARHLFPYDVEDCIYISVVDAVISNPAYLDALKECANALDGFLEMNDAQQIDAIRALESATFFEEVVNAVRSELHVRPELWMLIGCPLQQTISSPLPEPSRFGRIAPVCLIPRERRATPAARFRPSLADTRISPDLSR